MYLPSWTSHLVAMHDDIGNKSMVPQLDICLKFKSIQGKRLEITPQMPYVLDMYPVVAP